MINNENIHPTAIVASNSKIGKNVKIGAYTIIEDEVEIGDDTEISSCVRIGSGTTIGNSCRIFSNSILGTEPQDLKYKNEKTYLRIGDRTMIRELVTINRGTAATGYTKVGDDCMIMAYCHIAHDCHLGNNIIMANNTQFAGHVTVEDWVNFGAFSKVHQFCRIGKHAFVGADLKIVKDIAPYTLVGRITPKVEGINKIGLKRRNFPESLIKELDEFYATILFSGMNNSDGIKKYSERGNISPEIQYCIDFIKNSERGIYR